MDLIFFVNIFLVLCYIVFIILFFPFWDIFAHVREEESYIKKIDKQIDSDR